MTVKLETKRFYERSRQHANECYNAVVAPDPASTALAFLRVNGKRESLAYMADCNSPVITLASDTYILDPCFADGLLVWVERVGKKWLMRAVDTQADDFENVFEVTACEGRPRGLASCARDGRGWLVWEERQGKRTCVRLCSITGGKPGEPIAVTDGSYNVYDPDCAVAGDGTVFVAYCAFYRGNYRSMIRTFAPDGSPAREPTVVTDDSAPFLYPSVAARSDGGVWFSCTEVRHLRTEYYLQNLRSRAHHEFFAMHCFNRVRAGVFDGEKPLAAVSRNVPGGLKQDMNYMYVDSALGAGHSHVFEDTQGRARILLRQHLDPDEIRFRDDDDSLVVSEHVYRNGPANTHPPICLITLEDDGWGRPVQLIGRAHLEAPISYAICGDDVRFAFTQDGRESGWGHDSERFDETNEVGVGAATVELVPLGKPDHELSRLMVPVALAGSMAEPVIPQAPGEYIHAVGQTHVHTNISICMRINDRTIHMNYRFMQDAQNSDFGATADHDNNMWDTERLLTRKLAEYYYFPGEFVAIPAHEWAGSRVKHEGGPFGHVNPLWLEEEGDLEFYSVHDPAGPGRTLEKLWNAHKGKKIVTPPHHVADVMHPYFWHFFDEDFVPVIEIFQDGRGSGEKPGAPGVTSHRHAGDENWALSGLKQGRRFGFIGGADHGGIARGGVLVKELTRTGMYEGFMARRCFATTGMTARVEFTCNGTMMGSSVPCKSAEFVLKVAAPEDVYEVQIVRNGDEVETVAGSGKEFEYTWKAARRESGEFWYCRVVFENGEIAWSSPIWLD